MCICKFFDGNFVNCSLCIVFSCCFTCSNSNLVKGAEIVAVLDGIDEATSDNLQARYSYTAADIIWNAEFVDIVTVNQQTGSYVVDYHRFNNIITTHTADATRGVQYI